MLRRAALALLLVVACAASGTLAASVLADTPPPTDTTGTMTTASTTIAPGVTVGGVAVGGLTSDAAVAAVHQAFDRPVLLHLGATEISISPDLLGLSVAADTAVAKAMAAASDARLSLRASVNTRLVSAFVGKLAARFDRK